jgi:hypothetical protein
LAAIVEDRFSLESLRALNFTEENGVRAARRRLADIGLDVREGVTHSVDDVPRARRPIQTDEQLGGSSEIDETALTAVP